jgi:hypothetical protein
VVEKAIAEVGYLENIKEEKVSTDGKFNEAEASKMLQLIYITEKNNFIIISILK